METTDLLWREKLHVVAQIAQAGLAWLRHDTRFPSPVADNPKFMTAFDAARLIHDGDVLAVSGLGAHQRASILYWAIRERFERRGPALRDYVGPGGFIDFATHARTIVFVSSWMRGGEIALDDNGLRIVRHGLPKLVDRVEEITFDAPAARRRGQRVLYVTHAGVFELGRGGLELRCVMPGFDLKRDIADFAPGRCRLPAPGRLPAVPRSIVNGTPGFLRALPSMLRGAPAVR